MQQQAAQHTDTERKSMALFALALNYGKEMPEIQLECWMEMLTPFQPSVVERAVTQVIAEYEYKTLPPFAVLLKAIKSQMGQIAPETARTLAADLEWEKVQEGIRKCGRNKMPGFCEVTERAIRILGGWEMLCDCKEEYLNLRRKEFVEKWCQYAEYSNLLALGTERIMALSEGGERGQTVTERYHLPDNHPSRVGSIISDMGMFSGLPRAAMQ